MSHFSKINAEIKDVTALEIATKKLGLELINNGMCRYYYGSKKADMVVKLPGKYDVALKNKGTHYSLEADFYKGEVERYIGPNAGILMQQYSVEKVKIEAFKRALAVTENSDGEDIIVNLTDIETGGQINVVCKLSGKIDVKTTGFSGQSCMKFQDLENALGDTEEFSATMEMFETENEANENICIYNLE